MHDAFLLNVAIVGYLGFISIILCSLMDWSTWCFHTQSSTCQGSSGVDDTKSRVL